MRTAEQNERVTRVGPGTPMGETFRRYWLPVLMSEELAENDGAPKRVRLLGEDLVAFRDTDGRVGLVSAFCPHRRAPMFFGRNEERGLRCVYHGWKFDVAGTCVDMPSEPPDSLFKTKVTIEAYPTHEVGGLVWTYLGPRASAPPPPNFELLRVPRTHRQLSKTYEECNYLQGLEGGIDSSHSRILHHKGPGIGFLRDYKGLIPQFDVQKADYGFAYSASRITDDGSNWVRISHYFMPSMHMRCSVQPMLVSERAPHATMDGHIWVPIDDEHTWVYNYMYSYFPGEPLPHEIAKKIERFNGLGEGDYTPDFRLIRNRSNDYFIDRASQKSKTFTGIDGVNTQDFALQENMGPIVDRTNEHLGTIDVPIIATRQLLLEATNDVAAGRMPRGTDPAASEHVRAADEIIPGTVNWREALKQEMTALY
jgi:phthalate 4,5-dioxygenase